MISTINKVAPEKVYIAVSAAFMVDGTVLPRSFEWEDGNCYIIDRVVDMQHLSSLISGGKGIRYKVHIRNRETYIFLEEKHSGEYRWYVLRRER